MSNPPDHELERLYQALDSISDRLNKLTDRVDQLERADSPETPTSQAPAPQTPAPQTKAPPISPPLPEPPLQPLPKPTTTPPATRTEFPARPAPRRSPSPTPPPAPSPAPKPAFQLDPKSFEWMLGARGLALGGMLIVVIGVGMFLKYAFDEGWIANIPPVWRCLGAGLFGALLVAVGEVVRRKVNALASAGVSASGLAIMYASVLASTKLYDLLPVPAAFAVLALLTLGGVLLGAVSQRVLLSLLALIGAYAAPVLLSTGEPSYVVFPAYLISLLVYGLVLSGWLGGVFANVRRVAWWGTSVLGTLWLIQIEGDAPTSSLVFISMVWLATVAELVVSARFFARFRESTPWPETSGTGFLVQSSGEIRFNPHSFFIPEARWINSLFAVTAWAVVGASLVLRTISPELDALAPVAFGVASVLIATLALKLSPTGIDRPWTDLASPRSALAAALTINAAMLMVATIPMALGGSLQIAAWTMVGLAAVETSRHLRFRAVGIFGLLLLAVGAIRLATLDLGAHLLESSQHGFIGLSFTAWTPQVLMVAAAFALVAWRTRYSIERPLTAAIAMWLVAMSLIHSDTDPDSLGPAWAILAAITAWGAFRFPVRGLWVNAIVLAGLATAVTLFSQLSFQLRDTMTLDIEPVSTILVALSWAALAAVPGRQFHTRSAFAAITIIFGGLTIASVHDSSDPPTLLLYGSLYAPILLLLSKRLVRWSIAELTILPFAAVALGWAVHQLNLGEDTLNQRPLLTLAAALLTVASMVYARSLLARLPVPVDAPAQSVKDNRRLLITLFGAAAWLLLLASSSLEAERIAQATVLDSVARGAAVSIWWSLFAVGSIVAGFRLGPPLRWAGLALLAVVGVKVIFIDTQTLEPPARIVASITVGLVTIGAGILYAKLMDAENSADPEAEPEPSPDEPEPETHDET